MREINLQLIPTKQIPRSVEEIDPEIFRIGPAILTDGEVSIKLDDIPTILVVHDPYEAARLALLDVGYTPDQLSRESGLQGIQTMAARLIRDEVTNWRELMQEREAKRQSKEG